MAKPPHELYTIGHSRLGIEDFLRLLNENHIKVLVDVRSQPYSRFNPQFNRESLQGALTLAGIEYTFAGEYLGGRPANPGCYVKVALPAGKPNAPKPVDYQEMMKRDWYQQGIDRLLQIAAERPAAIMCGEEDPQLCHRHLLVAQTLLERGVTVWHIRSDGRIEEAEPLPPASQQLTLL